MLTKDHNDLKSVNLRTLLYFRAFTGQTCDSELIADLATKGSRLCKAEVLSIGGTPTANQACRTSGRQCFGAANRTPIPPAASLSIKRIPAFSKAD